MMNNLTPFSSRSPAPSSSSIDDDDKETATTVEARASSSSSFEEKLDQDQPTDEHPSFIDNIQNRWRTIRSKGEATTIEDLPLGTNQHQPTDEYLLEMDVDSREDHQTSSFPQVFLHHRKGGHIHVSGPPLYGPVLRTKDSSPPSRFRIIPLCITSDSKKDSTEIDREITNDDELNKTITPMTSPVCDPIIADTQSLATSSTRQEYIQRLYNCSHVAIQNEDGNYISCQKGYSSKVRGGVYNCEYRNAITEMESFTLEYNQQTGGFSFTSYNGLQLHYDRTTCCSVCFKSKEKTKAEWLVHSFLLPDPYQEQVLFVGILENTTPELSTDSPSNHGAGNPFASHEKIGDHNFIISRHADGSVPAWNTQESLHKILDRLKSELRRKSLSPITIHSGHNEEVQHVNEAAKGRLSEDEEQEYYSSVAFSTIFHDSETNYKWFVTKSKESEDLCIVITTENFPYQFGTQCVMELECFYSITLKDDNFTKRIESSPTLRLEDVISTHLMSLIVGIDDDYAASNFGQKREELRQLHNVMAENISKLQENMETTEDLLARAVELEDAARLFHKKTQELPGTEWPKGRKVAVAAGTVAAGGVGAVIGWSIGGPAAAGYLSTEAAEIALGAGTGLLFGIVAGTVCTSEFWKRDFISVGAIV